MLKVFGGTANEKQAEAALTKQQGPLQPLVDIVPENAFFAASSNGNMLQVIFFTILAGVGLILIPSEKSKTAKDFFDGAYEGVLKIVNIIMLTAQIVVYALITSLIAEAPSAAIFVALGMYSLRVMA